MTLGHVLFAATLTTYMALASFFEECDLVAYSGDHYETYCRTGPKFVPRWARARELQPETPAPVAPTA